MKKITNSLFQVFEFNGSTKDGDALFKVNYIGCHKMKGRGLVGPDLHSIKKSLNDKEITKQVTGGFTPLIPGFEIDPLNYV